MGSNILIDPYSERELTDYINLVKPFEPFLISNIFTTKKTHFKEEIDYEVKDITNKTAEFASEDSLTPTEINKAGTTEARTYKIPKTYESKVFTINEIKSMNALGNVYGSDEAKNRVVQENIAMELEDLQNRVVRLREVVAGEAITTGKYQHLTGKQRKFVYDFGFDNTKHKYTCASKWTVADYDPLKDIKEIKRKIARNSGGNPNLVIVGSDIADIIQTNKAIRAQLDNLNNKVGALDMTGDRTTTGDVVANNLYGMKWVEYNQQYTNKLGVATDIIPADACVFINTRTVWNRLHKGPISELDGKGSVKDFLEEYHITVNKDPRNKWISWDCEQRSMPMIHEPGVFQIISNIK